MQRILSQLTRSQRVTITRVRVEPKVHPTCQKIRAPKCFTRDIDSRLCNTQKPQSSESTEFPKTTPLNNPYNGIGSTGKDPIGGDCAQPQPESLPWWTPLVAETLANDPDFIQAEFHIGRFITAVVDTEADRLNTEALQTEMESTSTRIYVSNPCIIVHYRIRSILTSPFCSELNWAF
jgi:hypothetical protein